MSIPLDKPACYRRLIESTNVWLFIVAHDHSFAYCSPACEQLTGYTAEELMGDAELWPGLIHPDDHARWRSHQGMDAGDKEDIEFRIIHRDGSTRWIAHHCKPLLNDDGGLIGRSGIHRDITARKLAEEQLRKLSQAVEQSPLSVLITDVDGRIEYANAAFTAVTGYEATEVIGRNPRFLRSGLTPSAIHEDLWQTLKRGESWTGELINRRKDGEIFHEWERIVPDRQPDGRNSHYLAIKEDITERKRLDAELRSSNEKLRGLYELSRLGITLEDMTGRYIEFNDAFERICGYTHAELSGLDYWSLTPREYADQETRQMETLATTGAYGPYEKEYIRKDGSRISVRLNGVLVHGTDGETYIWSIVEDITEDKQKDDLIWRQANYDALTGLPNRRLFRDRLEQEIKKLHRTGHRLGLLFIDLDRFKDINDTLGHHKGDMLLTEAARRILRCVRETDTVARLGGDEFTVILPEYGSPLNVERAAQDILKELAIPFELGAERGYISASIGITVCPDDAEDAESLIKHADRAMYQAKEQGRNQFAYFTESMQRMAEEKLAMTNDLRHALEKNQLAVHYQPIIDLKSGRIVKAEALLRWMHPERGMVSPLEFIPLAEESGLIFQIGDWVFQQAVEVLGRWRSRFGQVIQISVNKSPVQFTEDSACHCWSERLDASGLPGNSITVEITEGMLIKDSPRVKKRLLEFRNQGIEVSIDDFGTGFSSLSYLKMFDIDYLKIDRSFVSNLAEDDSDKALTEAIIVMAHKLGIKTIAEGIETEAQRDMLVRFGCDYAQGYLFSRPIPAEAFENLLMRPGYH